MMWCLLGRCVHWVCDEGEIDMNRLKVRAVTGAPRTNEDLSVTVGRALLALDRSVNVETVLLLEARAGTMESMLEGLQVACWRLRRLVVAGGAVFLEGRRKYRRRLKTWEPEGGSLEHGDRRTVGGRRRGRCRAGRPVRVGSPQLAGGRGRRAALGVDCGLTGDLASHRFGLGVFVEGGGPVLEVDSAVPVGPEPAWGSPPCGSKYSCEPGPGVSGDQPGARDPPGGERCADGASKIGVDHAETKTIRR